MDTNRDPETKQVIPTTHVCLKGPFRFGHDRGKNLEAAGRLLTHRKARLFLLNVCQLLLEAKS